MNITTNLLKFKTHNIHNEPVTFENKLSPQVDYGNMKENHILTVKQFLPDMYSILQSETSIYLNDEDICPKHGTFPSQSELTGNYYITNESYYLEDTIYYNSRNTCYYTHSDNANYP